MAAKPYPAGYIEPKFQKFDARKGNPREHLCACLILQVPPPTILAFYEGVLKSLTDKFIPGMLTWS